MVLISRATAHVDADRLTRLVGILAAGLERLLTGKDCEREGVADEQLQELDFGGRQSVTTQDQAGPSEE